MADFVPRKFAATSINNGQRFNARDGVTANAVNAPIEAALYVQKLVENPIDDVDVGSVGVPTITIEEGPNGPYFKFANFAGLVGMTPQDVLTFIAAHNDNVNAHPQLYAKIQEYVDKRFEAYEPEGGTIDGSVEPVPDSIAQRDTYGSLYGKNETEYDDPEEIDTYVDADELITRDTLKKYAIPKPRGSAYLQTGVYVRTAERTELYGIDMYPQKDSINFITSGGVYRSFESYKDDLSLIFATREELEAKQNKLTFDKTPTKDSLNPVTSGGVFAEFYEFSTAYDQIIDNAKTECKQYTDEQIQEDVGDIDTALNEILEIQEDLLDGSISVSSEAEAWRLIQSITLKEERIVIVDVDQNGIPFSLEKVMVIILFPSAVESKQLWLKHNAQLAVYTNAITGTLTAQIKGEYNKAYDDWFYETAVATSNAVPVQSYKFPRGHRFVGYREGGRTDRLDVELNSISLATNSALTGGFPVGTKITVLGVDA